MELRRARSVLGLALALLSIGFPRPAIAAASTTPPVTDERARELVLAAADVFETTYVEPEKGKSIAAELRRRAERGRYDGVATVSTLADRLTGDLQEIGRDKHLGARFDPQLAAGHAPMIRRQIGEPRSDGPGEGPIRVVRSEGPPDPVRVERDRRYNFGFHTVERLDGNVGYLELREFSPLRGARDTVAGAMAFLANSDAIILDLRRCPGGTADTVSFLASYFFGPGRHELFSRYDRPVNDTRVEYTTEDLPGRRMPDVDVWIVVGPDTAAAARRGVAADLVAFSGRYGERTVAVEAGRLVCRASNGRTRTMDPVGSDAFTRDDQTRASFARDASGRPAELVLERIDGTIERFPRQPDSRGKEPR